MRNIRNILSGFLVLSTLALCFVWPIPNKQIYFNRNILIYNVIFFSFGLFMSSSTAKKSLNLHKTKFVFIVISLLTIFILVNGFFVSPNIRKMVFTWNGQWLRPVLLFFSGIVILPVIQSRFSSISASYFFTLIILFFWGVICIHLLDAVWLYLHDGTFHFGETRIVYNRTRMSFQVNMSSGFLITELIARSLLHQRFLYLNTPILTIMLLFNFACTTLVDTRWGTIGLMGTLFSTFILFAIHGTRHRCQLITGCILLGIAVASALLGYASWNIDSRWHSLSDDAIIGWKTSFNSFCYIQPNGIVPKNNLGLPINHSNGCRASFFHQGWKLIGAHPTGMGPYKEAFRYILRRDTHNDCITISHSHYGLIEFGIQNGVIGILGWLILLVNYWHIGWREFRCGNAMIGMFLLLFTVNFFSRTMVDHNLKDHYLEQYMFLTGLLIGMCSLNIKQASSEETIT